MMLRMLLLAAIIGGSETIKIDESGRVRVSSDERLKEQRNLELLRDAETYYNANPEVRTAIEKYEIALESVALHPKIKEDVLLKVAELYVRSSEQPATVLTSPGERAASYEADLRDALQYYARLLAESITETRPVLLAATLLRVGDIHCELGENQDAALSFLRARRIALDKTLPIESPGMTARRTFIADDALGKIVILFDKPFSQHFRERLIRECGDDAQMMNALRAPGDSGTGAEASRHGTGGVHTGLFLAVASLTVGIIVMMRRRVHEASLPNWLVLPGGSGQRREELT